MNIIKWLMDFFTPANNEQDLSAFKLAMLEYTPPTPPTIIKQEFWEHGFMGNLIVAKPRKPERKQSCKGCGSFEYKVIDNCDVCEYCGRGYERTDLKPNPNIKSPVFTTTGWLTNNDIRKLNNLPLVPLSPNDILEY